MKDVSTIRRERRPGLRHRLVRRDYDIEAVLLTRDGLFFFSLSSRHLREIIGHFAADEAGGIGAIGPE